MKHIKSYQINESKDVLQASIENAIENDNTKLLINILKRFKDQINEYFPDNTLLITYIGKEKYHHILPVLIKYRNSDKLKFSMFDELNHNIYYLIAQLIMTLSIKQKEYTIRRMVPVFMRILIR